MHNLSGMDKYKGTKTMDKEIVANFENLYRSYKKVKSGKKFNSVILKATINTWTIATKKAANGTIRGA